MHSPYYMLAGEVHRGDLSVTVHNAMLAPLAPAGRKVTPNRAAILVTARAYGVLLRRTDHVLRAITNRIGAMTPPAWQLKKAQQRLP